MCHRAVSRYFFLFIVMCVCSASALHAQWSGSSSENTPVVTDPGQQYGSSVVSDGAGGAYTVWVDNRSLTNNIYIQHFNATGIALWGANGKKICSVDRTRSTVMITSDEAGGAIVAWIENQGGATGDDIYVQRFNSAGQEMWTADGVLTTGADYQNLDQIVSDGNGGVFLAFNDWNGDTHVYGQWVNSSGAVQWGTGTRLSTSLSNQSGTKLVADGNGNAIYVWNDNVNNLTHGIDIYAQKINAAGQPVYAATGLRISSNVQADMWPKIISDGNHGAIITWQIGSGPGAVYAERINGSGTRLWASGAGISIAGSVDNYSIATNGSNGMIVAWRSGDHIRSQNFDGLGTAQWTPGGVTVRNTTGTSDPFISPDGSGGVYVMWTDNSQATADLLAQHLNSSGTAVYAAGGIMLSNATGNQQSLAIVTRTGQAGMIATWTDDRNGNEDIYMQLLLPTGFPPHLPPTVQSFTPASGPAGTSVTITGYGFNPTTSNNIVYFGGVKATVTAATSTTLTVTVPSHVTYAQVTVLNTVLNLQGRSRGFYSGSHTPATTDLSKFDFAQAQTWPVSGGSATKVLTADMDGDGKPDVIAFNSFSAFISIYRNIATAGAFGSGSLGSQLGLNTNGKPEHVSVGDIDNDGKPDLVISDWQNHKVYVARNTSTPGNFSFASLVTLSAQFPYSTTITDIDGDGKADIVASTLGGNTLTIFQNSSTPGNLTAATFSAPVSKQVAGASTVNHIASGDLDGDGKDDLLVGDGGVGQIKMYVLQNTHTTGAITSASFGAAQAYTLSATADGIAGVKIADVDMDGKPEIIGTTYASSSVVAVCRNIATPGTLDGTSFEPLIAYTSDAFPYELTVGDVDGDAKPDIAVAGVAANAISILKNLSTPGTINAGSFSKTVSVNGVNGLGTAQTLALADMDGDGRTEILGAAGTGFGVLYNSPLVTPTSQATNLVFTLTNANSGTLGWTNGNGASRMVFVNTGSTTGLAAPVDLTSYFVNSNVTFGGQIGSSGWRAVYMGAGSSTVINGLVPGGTYRMMVVEMNNNGYTMGKYLTTAATGNPINASSPAEITFIGTVNPATNNLGIVDFMVGFSGSITGLTAANFALSTTGSIAGAAVLTVIGSGTTYGVSVATGSGDGTIGLNFVNASGLSAGITTPLPYEGSYYTIDKTGPALTPLTIASNNGLNTRYARTGSAVTVRFTRPGETISSISGSIAGTPVVMTNSGFDVIGTLNITAGIPEGQLTFTVSANDYLGNTTTATQTTNGSSVTIDNTAPQFTGISITSDNSDAGKAKPGNRVTLRFTTSEATSPANVTLAGQVLSVTNTGGNNWEGSRIFNAEAEGVVAFSIRVNDLAGNSSQAATATTDNTTVVFDKTIPVLNSITIASGNSAPANAKVGDVVTVRFIASEAIKTPAVTIATHAVVALNTTGNAWAAVYTMTAADAEGTVPFTIAFTDLAGNAGTATSLTTNNSKVVFDKTIPALNSVTIASGNTVPANATVGDVVTVRFTASESIKTPTVTIATHAVVAVNTTGNAWAAAYTMTAADADGIVPFSIAFTDLAGNAGTATSLTTNNSKVTFVKNQILPAQLTQVKITSTNAVPYKAKTGDGVTLHFVSDASLVGVTATIAAHTVTPVNTTGNAWSAVYTLTAADDEGKVPFTIAAVNLGLSATGSTDNSKVWFDKTLPVVTAINRHLPAAANVVSGPLVYRVQFSEPVNGVEKRNFRITKTGSAAAAIDSILVANDSTYDVRLSNLSGSGTLRFDLDTTGNIADSAGNALVSKFNTGQSYNVVVPSNNKPVFVAGSTATRSVCQDATSADLSALLRTTDTDNGQTLTWRVSMHPANGVLENFPATAASDGSIVGPSSVGYKPAAGFKGMDQFVIQVSDGIDSAAITVNVTVQPLPSENIIAAQGTVLCGSNASLALTIANGSSFSWTRNGSSVAGNSNQLSVNTAGTYAAIVTDANGCVAATNNSITITTAQQPKAAFAYAGYCVNVPVLTTNQSAGASTLSYQWSDGNGNTSTAAQPSFTYTQPGSYTIKLKVSSSACPLLPDSLSKVINVEGPVAGVRMSTINAQVEQAVQLQARTFGATYQWTPANDLSSATIANPVLRARAEQQYNVSIRSAAGCTTVDTVLVKVFANTIYVPRVFTPNGDGNNDVLYFNYINVRKLDYVRIYNRQGKLVWQSSNMSEGWDGRFNGALQPLETYTWLIRATDIYGVPVNMQGNVTLLR
ncbi:T9SS type B sorting domain-containing protein [Sediminibacterium roseum]|uniref:T9SS type B sorting domain-containing protein n=1 Tax=Sediminibacterium roseum TaxID=1978412 RepID=A0ABW9ZT92_9BACT|nr:FG-GAP-like repeat-containing protein [Sediminibacterium roseum]NCI50335.1 T9SS type B sorting domain-containing protein [Sediminibacterium roseum]